MLPAKRIPTAALQLKGAFDKDPKRGRARAHEPKPDGPLGPPPEEFLRNTPEMQKHLAAWHKILAIVPEGVLTSMDFFHVKQTAQYIVICDRSSATAAQHALLNKLLGQMGCNPADRSRVAAKKAKAADARTPDDWSTLAAERLPQPETVH